MFPSVLKNGAKIIHLAQFLGTFADLWKVTVSSVLPVCPFVCMDQIGCHWIGFHLSVFQKSVTKI
jgi:hypothetical protein